MPRNRRKDWAFCGVEKEFMASTLYATGAIPLSETICPKKRSRFWPNKHLAALMINPLRCRRSNTCRRWDRCSSMEDENINMSSISVFFKLFHRDPFCTGKFFRDP